MSSALRLAAAAAVLTLLSSSSALAENQNRTIIQIATVLASNSERSFDPRLAGMRGELKQLRFRSYQLVSSETRILQGNGGQCGMELPHGRFLNITTREHAPDHLRLHILLNEDNRPILNTYVKLELGSVVMLGGPRDEGGTLVIAIASRPARGDDDGAPTPRRSADQGGKQPSASPQAAAPPPPPSPAGSTLVPSAPAQGGAR